jgi:uncharacterized protein (TIGR02145 family)
MKTQKLFLCAFVVMTAMMLTSCGSFSNDEITIGTQTWSSKNLDVSTYRNGDTIPQVQDANAWRRLTTGAWCYYKNKTANGTIYGKLYNWYAVNDPRGLAPKGYHVPTDTEWTTLITYLGGQDVAGTKMKSTSGWNGNGNGTNISGFSALPGGCFCGGTFDDIGSYGYWWCSAKDDANVAWVRLMVSGFGFVYGLPNYSKGCGFSVRCVRDN